MHSNSIRKLIDCFRDLPGVGEKSAERFVYSMLNFDPDRLDNFANCIVNVKNNVKKCQKCGNFTENDELCDICSNTLRNDSVIFVVEKPKDVILFEKVGNYDGVYHVLNGLISPLEGINPDDINLQSLVDRIKNGNVKEVIIALKPSLEGETTTQYIRKIIEQYNVRVSRIATGIPMGTDIEYIDPMTLEMAFEERKYIS